MFDAATLIAYSAAAALLVAIPGPGTAWIVAQTISGGRRRGLRAALGLETATLIHALAAALGLSAVLATSALAFDIVKYLGAAYLVWLGIQAWRSGAPATDPAAPAAPMGGGGVYLRSVLTGVLNPKVAIFFIAFLPQFVRPERGHVLLQFLVLGAILAAIGFTGSVLVSWGVARMGRRLSASPRWERWQRRLTGTLFVGLGMRLALQQRG